MSQSKKFYLIIALQIIFLLSLIGTKVFTLQTGEKILLEVVPVDPRDIFRGEYARLNYKISTVALPDMNKVRNNQIVYVTLRRGEKYWEVAGVGTKKPILKNGDIFITGKKRQGNRVEYGIESYYVPEEKAVEIERVRQPAKVSVEVSVDRFGNSAINQIFIDNKLIGF